MTKKNDERVAIDQKALRRMNRDDFLFCTHAQIAGYLGIHQTNITRAYASGPKAEGVSPALLNAMVAKGYLDRREVNEVLKVEVTPCPECLEAHTVPWCTEREGEPVKAPYNRKGASKPKPRVRWAPDVPAWQKDEMTAEAKRIGVSHRALQHEMWQAYLSVYSSALAIVLRTRQERLADAATEE